jgi:hypothetical protein
VSSFFCAFSNAEASRCAIENRFQCDLAILQNFERALPFGESSGSYNHYVASSRGNLRVIGLFHILLVADAGKHRQARVFGEARIAAE